MGGLPSWLLAAIFVVSVVVIWVARVRLSDGTDVLSERLHLGAAIGGLVLLALATNLPEIAITVSAAVAHQLDVAVGNILGGIAIQTVVLVALDAFGVRPRKPLTYQAAITGSAARRRAGGGDPAGRGGRHPAAQVPDLRPGHAPGRADRRAVGSGPAPAAPSRHGSALERQR